MVYHIFHGHFNGSVQSHDHHAQGVPHQDDIHPGFCGHQSQRIVIGGQHGQFAAFFFCLFYIED